MNDNRTPTASRFRTLAPLPLDLTVKLERVPLRPDGWADNGRDAASRPNYSIRLERNGRKAGPFYWTGPVDAKHAQAIKDGRLRRSSLRQSMPRGDLTPEEAMASLALDASCYLDSGPDLDTFAADMGYAGRDSKPSEAVHAFEGCRKAWEAFAMLGLDPHSDSFREA